MKEVTKTYFALSPGGVKALVSVTRERLVNLIFNAGNEGAPVDDSWFDHGPMRHGQRCSVIGLHLVSPEEMACRGHLSRRVHGLTGGRLAPHPGSSRTTGLKRLYDRFGIHWWGGCSLA